MKPLSLALVAGALAVLLASPVPAGPGDAPTAPTASELRASMLESDSIQLARVEIDVVEVRDSSGQARDDLRTKRVSITQVKSPWMKRFVAHLLPEDAEVRPDLCPTPRPTAGSAKPWMVSALWITRSARGQAYLDFSNACAFAGLAGRKPVGLALAHPDSLFALFQEGLFADSALKTMKLGAPSAAIPAETEATSAPGPAPNSHGGLGSAAEKPDKLPEPIEKVMPVYPDAAREARAEGTVVISAMVGADGRTSALVIKKGIPMLDAAAVEAVRQWRFKPGQLAGKPVPVRVEIPVEFHLAATPEKPKH